ncbi:MAG: hypothetical protein QOH29_1043, partial [Actinomycetota bacterium]|nr:hypothetical protein [Actinomycetota bacterium]
TETGVLAEFSHHGLQSRIGTKRTDVKHQILDPIIITGPCLARLVVIYLAIKAFAKHRTS